MANNYTCVFLRRKFTVTDPYEFGALTLSAKCDDGYIAWINGVEVARYNHAGGFRALFDGLAVLSVPEPAPYIATNIFNPSSFLLAGTNVLAIQVFNSTLGSEDFQFNASSLGVSRYQCARGRRSCNRPASSVVRTLRSWKSLSVKQ